MQAPAETVVQAWAGLVRAQRAATQRIEADLKTAGLPPLAWYGVLYGLRRAPRGRLTPRDLEAAMLLEQYNLSRLLDRMEGEGLVTRAPYPGDARRQFVQITVQGRRLQKRMWPVYGAAIQRHVGVKLSDREAELLVELLCRIAAPPSAPPPREPPRPGSPP